MRLLDKLRLRLRSLLRRPHADRELADELRFHLDQLIEEHRTAGMPPQEARSQALREMGGIAQFQEECRDMRRVNFVDDLARDLRYAGRSLRRSPGFAALAVLIMALGIGANTAVFSVVNTVLLKPLAYRDADRIVTLAGSSALRGSVDAASKPVSVRDVRDWRAQSTSFDGMAYYNSNESPVLHGSTADYARTTRVSADFFRVFAVEPLIGRPFTAEDVAEGSGGAVLLSYAYWQNQFAGDPGVLGRTLRLRGNTLAIAGVLPPDFRFPGKTDFWFPDTRPPTEPRSAHNYSAVGRLKPGVSLERAQSEIAGIARRLEQQYPDTNKGRSVALTRIREELVGDVRLTLYLLFGAVSVVLLVACANTATLLLGRATARTREVAVRVALGAGRRRIVKQMITESLLLALLAGAAGLLLAYAGAKALVALAPAGLPRLRESRIDAGVLAFTLVTTLATTIVFGLVPALFAAQVDLIEGLRLGGTRTVIGGGIVRMRGALVVAEIAMAVVLLSAAGLLVKSYAALQNSALGFRPENVLVMRATVPNFNTPEQARLSNRFFRNVLARAASLPGVVAAGATMMPPGQIDALGSHFVDRMPARLAQHDMSAPNTVLSVVAPGTFAALGIPLKSGRDFEQSDDYDRPFVAVINDALARVSFPGVNPIGRTIFCPFDSGKGMTIVGVVGDVRQGGPAHEPMPECYMSYQQHGYNSYSLSLVLRTSGNPGALEETLRRVAHQESPDIPIRFTTMEARLSENVAIPRFRTMLFGLFAALAICLAMAGIYGVTAYTVGRQSGEIGLRMALGASAGSVLKLIIGQGLGLAAAGLAVGLAVAVAVTRLLRTMLFQVQPNDPLVFAAVVALVGIVTLAASYIPARRASKIDPQAALRQDY